MISLIKVSKFFNERPVIRGVSLSVAGPSVTLLSGPNGAGKTTLLRLMAGLLTADEGGVECGLEPGAVGYLGHQPFLYAKLTALENLKFWRSLHAARLGRGAKERELLAELEAVNLADFAHERAGTFSRGMLQRLNLARLMLLKPSLILLDEPETGLDSASRDMLLARMQGARDAGAAVLWISHGIGAAGVDLKIDRLLRLERGALVYDGPPEAVAVAQNFAASDTGAVC